MTFGNLWRLCLIEWPRRWSQRQDLAELAEERLQDLGLSRKDALAESRRPFWATSQKRDPVARPSTQTPARAAVSQNPANQP
ncbi:uncharacterized protein YjiS (DUF1127 family) [Rhizobium aquaticum]|uniref:Uncharacterized protein YjiS (DUF1127 family) n=1 Tax=Rhizobium aquaticum TaxID=1549636 RepID=A0ABV2IX41_9HYPH